MSFIAKEIENYAAQHCTPENGVLQSLKQATYAQTSAPQMQVGRDSRFATAC
jgi:hypothetical protein